MLTCHIVFGWESAQSLWEYISHSRHGEPTIKIGSVGQAQFFSGGRVGVGGGNKVLVLLLLPIGGTLCLPVALFANIFFIFYSSIIQ